MSIGLRCSGIWTEIGDYDFLHAFFSTISYHFESNKWGSKYPYLQEKLNYVRLDPDDMPNALEELEDIRMKFMSLKPEDVVWNAEDLSIKAPESFYTHTDASNLSECFITSGKKNLFDVFSEVFEFSKGRFISVNIQGR